MDVDVELGGLPDLVDRLAHAQQGILQLERDMEAELLSVTPTQLVAESPRMRPRLWGVDDVWTLPAGGWIVGKVQLPNGLDQLQDHVQDLLDGH